MWHITDKNPADDECGGHCETSHRRGNFLTADNGFGQILSRLEWEGRPASPRHTQPCERKQRPAGYSNRQRRHRLSIVTRGSTPEPNDR